MKEILKEKPVLNIVIADGSSSIEYVNYLSKEFKVNVIDFKDIQNKKDVDLVLFTGGEDVSPVYYNENQGQFTYTNENRDIKEIKVFDFFKRKVPMLGICRGAQFLTVMNGGKLIQHVDGHGRDHTIAFKENYNSVLMTSSHHQMIYPFNLKDEDYELIAYSEYFKSNTYLNGDNQEIVLVDNFLEPEIVFYPKTKCLGIQGHPEYNHCDEKAKQICMKLIKKYLINKDSDNVDLEDICDANMLKMPNSLGNIIEKYKFSFSEQNLEENTLSFEKIN